MRGTVKRIVVILLALALVLFFLIPAVRRMDPEKDVVPPQADTVRTDAPPRSGPRGDEHRVRDEQETPPRDGAPIDMWRSVASWDGIGPVTTEPFAIRGHSWRIVWETEVLPGLGAGNFQIMIFDEHGGLTAVAAGTTRTERGANAFPGPGRFTLQINTLQKWKVQVEERG